MKTLEILALIVAGVGVYLAITKTGASQVASVSKTQYPLGWNGVITKEGGGDVIYV